jgi:UDP-N-acetylglucosamine diphosphorylase/glucosamine-1-phosphate N-acetyltransferase
VGLLKYNIDKPLTIVILAAGKGTRMNSELPKVLHEINGIPMIEEVIKTAEKLNPKKIIAIIGYKKELVKDALVNYKIDFAIQKEQNGTAHAVQQCEEQLEKFDGDLLVLSGDVPLITSKTLNSFIELHQSNNSKASLISTNFKNPFGYGRIIRNKNNSFLQIIEQKDANKVQEKINEINSGIYLFDSKTLFKNIHLIENKNMQKEYYLTDIFNYINKNDISVLLTKNENEIYGINTIEQLKEISI